MKIFKTFRNSLEFTKATRSLVVGSLLCAFFVMTVSKKAEAEHLPGEALPPAEESRPDQGIVPQFTPIPDSRVFSEGQPIFGEQDASSTEAVPSPTPTAVADVVTLIPQDGVIALNSGICDLGNAMDMMIDLIRAEITARGGLAQASAIGGSLMGMCIAFSFAECF